MRGGGSGGDRGGSGGKGSIYSFSSFFSGPSLVETCNAFWTLCSLPFLQYVKYQDQNPPPKLDFNADRTSRRYITVLFFVLDEITSPWNFNKQLFQAFRRREKKMRWVNGNVAMVFTLGAFLSVFLVHSCDNFRSFFLQTAVSGTCPAYNNFNQNFAQI